MQKIKTQHAKITVKHDSTGVTIRIEPREQPLGHLIPLTQYATETGQSPRTLRTRAKNGKLPGVTLINGRYMIPHNIDI